MHFDGVDRPTAVRMETAYRLRPAGELREGEQANLDLVLFDVGAADGDNAASLSVRATIADGQFVAGTL